MSIRLRWSASVLCRGLKRIGTISHARGRARTTSGGMRLADFPGMANVCLLHAMAYRDHGDLTWRDGGTNGCLCERASHAAARLRGELAWARQDMTLAAARVRQLEAAVRNADRHAR